jgi:hypothetical protein
LGYVLLVKNWIHWVIFSNNDLNIFRFGPVIDLGIPLLGIGRIIIIIGNTPNFLDIIKLIKHLQIVSLKQIKLPLPLPDIPIKFPQTFNHKLHTIMIEVFILFGIDLFGWKDEDGKDGLGETFQLQD